MKMKMNFNLSFQSENQENELISNHYMILFNKKVNIIQSRVSFLYACTVNNFYLLLFIVIGTTNPSTYIIDKCGASGGNPNYSHLILNIPLIATERTTYTSDMRSTLPNFTHLWSID